MGEQDELEGGGRLLTVCSLATVPAVLLAGLVLAADAAIVAALVAGGAGVSLPLGPVLGAELVFDLFLLASGAGAMGVFWGGGVAVLAGAGLRASADGGARFRLRLRAGLAVVAVSIVLGWVLPSVLLVWVVGSSLSGLLV